MDDIDRIEVISGPGATLWGANAMNGVINIITRHAQETTGGLVRATGGDQESAITARYGQDFGDGDAFRVYAKAFDRGPSELESGESAGDRWHKVQTGFRVDLGARVTPTASPSRATTRTPPRTLGAFGDIGFTQHDLLGRWEHDGQQRRHAAAGVHRRHRPRPATERRGILARHV